MAQRRAKSRNPYKVAMKETFASCFTGLRNLESCKAHAWYSMIDIFQKKSCMFFFNENLFPSLRGFLTRYTMEMLLSQLSHDLYGQHVKGVVIRSYSFTWHDPRHRHRKCIGNCLLSGRKCLTRWHEIYIRWGCVHAILFDMTNE